MNSNDTGEFNDSEAFKRRRTSEASDSTDGMTSSHGKDTSKHITEATLPHDGANSSFRRDLLTEPAPPNNNMLEDETKNVYNNDVMPNQSCTPMETALVGPNINETSSSSNLSSYTLPNRMSERTMGTISTSSSDLDHTLSSIASETVRATPIFTTADGVALPPIDPLLLARTRSLLFEDDDTDYSGGSREHNGNPRNNAAFVLSKMGHHQNATFKSLPFVSPRVIQPRKDITKAAVDAKRNLNDSCRAQFRMPSARTSEPKDTKNVSISHNDSKPVVKRTKKILTLSELWHKNSTSTTHDMSNLSPAKLSEMWMQYGNPFCTNYDNALKFKYINYSTKDSSVTIGGVEEFHQCLKQWVEQMDECRAKKRKIFKEWFHEKYRLFTARKCRIYRRNIHKLMRNNHTLEDALLMVQLPNPLDILKRIQKVCDDEHRGKESTLTKIFYGDEQCNVPVVVSVEHVDGDHLKIADESSVFVAFAADEYVKEQIKNKCISRGTKIRLHGVRFVPDDYGDQMVELRFNQISPAANQHLGLQNRHTNVNIRELKIGGGSVAKMDVTILSICPPAYKVTYKEKETTVPKTVVLSGDHFNAFMSNSELSQRVNIEYIETWHKLYFIDTIILSKIKKCLHDTQKFEQELINSTGMLSMRNMHYSVLEQLRKTPRMEVTSLQMQSRIMAKILRRFKNCDDLVRKTPFFMTTSGSSVLVNEHDYRLENIRKFVENYKELPQNKEKGKNRNVNKESRKSIYHTLLLGEPAMSISPYEENEFYELMCRKNGLNNDENVDVFIGQLCAISGNVIEVTEIGSRSTAARPQFKAFFLTTRLSIAAVTIRESVDTFPLVHDRSQTALTTLDLVRYRLMRYRLILAKDPKGRMERKCNPFAMLKHLTYIGYDTHNGVHNFEAASHQVEISNYDMFKPLVESLNDGIIFVEGKTAVISCKAVKAKEGNNVDKHSLRFISILSQAKLKIKRLLCTMDDEQSLCNEMIQACS